MAAKSHGRISWALSIDEDANREYTIKFLVEADKSDGPTVVANASGLPVIGSSWTYGNDNDSWAFRTPYVNAVMRNDNEPNEWWEVEFKFMTPGHPKQRDLPRCNNTSITNPIFEPDRISGSFTNTTKKVWKDRIGLIKNTAHQPIGVDFDETQATVRIEQNRLLLDLATVTSKINKVNSTNMWGLTPRKIKFSRYSWKRKLYGVCNFYYTQTLEFDVRFDTFDRDDIPDESSKMIRGNWTGDPPTFTADVSADPLDPKDYIQATDDRGNPTTNWLDANGEPSSTPTFINVEYYDETNLIALGIPPVLT